MSKMMQHGRSRRWCCGFVVLGVVGFLTACAAPGGDGCGGIEDLVSCLSVNTITPTATAGGDTSDVDVVQDVCSIDAATGAPEREPFTAHNATISFSNDLFPGASGGLGIRITRVQVVYILNNCPTGAVCPPLPGFSQATSLVIPASGTATATFPLVPISVKQAFTDQGGDVTAFPSYDAQYTFTASTQSFSDTITLESNVAFTVGNFNNCP